MVLKSSISVTSLSIISYIYSVVCKGYCILGFLREVGVILMIFYHNCIFIASNVPALCGPFSYMYVLIVCTYKYTNSIKKVLLIIRLINSYCLNSSLSTISIFD